MVAMGGWEGGLVIDMHHVTAVVSSLARNDIFLLVCRALISGVQISYIWTESREICFATTSGGRLLVLICATEVQHLITHVAITSWHLDLNTGAAPCKIWQVL